MADLKIEIASARSHLAFGEPLALTCTVKNVSTSALFVVSDTERIAKTKQAAQSLELVMGAIAAPGINYYGFRVPKLRRLAPGASFSIPASIGMPLQETVVKDGIAGLREIELAGNVEVTLAVGYGNTRFSAATPDPLGEFLAWQRLARSNKLQILIDPRGPTQVA